MKRNFRIGGWAWEKFEKEFRAELIGPSCFGKVNKAAIHVLREAQTDFVKSLPSQEEYIMPFITGNLHDSIVSVLSSDGRVIHAAYTDPVATQPSVYTGKTIFKSTKGGGRKRIVGSLEAFTDVKNMQGKYPRGLAASLMVSVPYAENPNELSETNKKGTHVGYLDALGARYYKAMQRGFTLYDAYNYFTWKGAPLTYDIPIGR